MARDPGSVWAPLSEAGTPDGRRKDKFIVHSTGTRASAAANRRYFEQAAVVVESTFIVGLTSADPTLQIMDSTDVADANGDANGSGISVEVVGLATDPFTPWQESELIRLGIWSRANHPIPAQIIPNANGGGLGWHVMFGAPGPWTSVRGKECPGPVRIAALRSRILPAIIAGHGSGTPTATAQEAPDMLADERALLFKIGAQSDATNGAVGRLEVAVSDKASGLLARTAQLEGKVAGLVTALNQIKGGGTIDQSAIDAAAERGAAAFGAQLADALSTRTAYTP